MSWIPGWADERTIPAKMAANTMLPVAMAENPATTDAPGVRVWQEPSLTQQQWEDVVDIAFGRFAPWDEEMTKGKDEEGKIDAGAHTKRRRADPDRGPWFR